LAAAPLLGWPQAQYVQPPAKEYIPLLEDPHRVGRLQPDRIIAALALKPGDVVADIGSGSGLFTRPLARQILPGGWVYAVDIDPELLEHVAKASREQGIANFSTILGRRDSPGLPPRSVDLVFICDTLHHIQSRQAYLANLKPLLKPGGRLAILDFEKNWPAGHESLRFSLQDLERWTAAAGYRKVEEHGFVPDNFFHVYMTR
jgi:ubiquinone/menaquinone biosynthesis C-methylase UbiE